MTLNAPTSSGKGEGPAVERALAYAREHREQNLEDLRRLLRQPSVAAQDLGMEDCARLVAAMMEEVGLKAEVVPLAGGHPVVYGELDAGAARTLAFYNHYDVQPPEPLDEWESDPFSAAVRDGMIYARGVADNKGNLVARLKAIQAWLEGEGRLPVNVKLVVEGEEEIGSVHLHDFVHHHGGRLRDARGVVWESGSRDARGRPVISFGCKGILYVELVARGANQDLHSSQAAIVENPAWRLVAALNNLKDLRTDRCLIDGFYDDVRPPTERELDLLRRYPLEEAEMLRHWGISRFIGGLTGLDLALKLFYEPTCTICGLVSGYTGPGSKTVLPRAARAKLDFRLVPDQRAGDVLEKLRRHLARRGFGDIEIRLLGPEDPGQTPADDPLIEVVAESARETYRTEPVIRPRMAGTGPMYLFNRDLGLPTVSGAGIGYHGSLVHAPNEHCRVEDYHLGVEHVIRLLDRFARVEAPPRRPREGALP